MQGSGFLNYRLKYCWPKVIYYIRQPNELKREIKNKTGGKQGPTKHLGGPWSTQAPLRIATVCKDLQYFSLQHATFHIPVAPFLDDSE